MDTGTHFVMGLALGAIATLDPVVGNDIITTEAVVVGTLLGSQAPDIDTVLKLKNNAAYIRNHRGITHSIPAVFLWPIIITLVVYLFSSDSNFLHLWIWTFVAVILHVFVDIFNAYGTQALRPFSNKWLALGLINTFDPFIFAVHIPGFILWSYFDLNPGYTFLIIYGVIILYYIARFIEQRKIFRKIHHTFDDVENITISPTMKYNKWHLAITTKNSFYVAKYDKRTLNILDEFDKVDVPDNKIMNATKQDKNLKAFLSFSPVYQWELTEHTDHYEVRFIDLRYRSKDEYYPFVAIVQLDQDLNILSSYTGWIFSEAKLRKKLNPLT
ncbi:metal-dependent hydrolase [Bacillus carboniphilus]|uniref:Metal-dependent hydrolase n=1 Tax=Bacillus carboniphilus TaxID=86663 RepID=A0ABY9JV59_9BACI|nr:metal-dependent hydrolase [Bacillus carboniphilus]WLR42674.1 metal-dependent hydrolase [Bacillus carboniphilus]